MVYNEVIILPWWGFKESVTKHRAYAKIIHGGSPDDDGAEYLAQSPAIYDSSRQDRKNSALMRTMNNDLIMKDDI